MLLGFGVVGCGDSGGGNPLVDAGEARSEVASQAPGEASSTTAASESAAPRPGATTGPSAPPALAQPELPVTLFGLQRLPQDPDGDVARFVGRENAAHDPELSGMRTVVYGTDTRDSGRFAYITIAGPGETKPRLYLEELSGLDGEVRVTSPLPGAFRCWNFDSTGVCAWADDTRFLAVGARQNVAPFETLVRDITSIRRTIYGS
ncbi:hypothetical protein EHYA_04534 [Embleya hyalina]|uniref:Uncharacterized protein n=1 Tax=Embleya hyalina TaxID=516124 RepID=A0A401YQK9_9ACTN|nr:hypothetical protein EHYA_04534 [Embleya hyalina]